MNKDKVTRTGGGFLCKKCKTQQEEITQLKNNISVLEERLKKLSELREAEEQTVFLKLEELDNLTEKLSLRE